MHAEVSLAILCTLAAAGEDDVVVIAFAGCGSPYGKLVLFDTSAADLFGTSLSMAGLADAFKSTNARAVLCSYSPALAKSSLMDRSMALAILKIAITPGFCVPRSMALI